MSVCYRVREFACMGVIGLYVLAKEREKSKKIGSLFSNCPRINQLNLPTRSSFSRGNFLVFPAALVSLQSDGHSEGKVGFGGLVLGKVGPRGPGFGSHWLQFFS